MSGEFFNVYGFVGVIAAWLALFLASVYQEARVIRHLRTHHVEVWEGLGEPPPFRRLRRGEMTAAFFRGGEHKRLGDAKLERMVALQRVLSWTYIATFLLFLALFFREGARR